MFKFAHILCQRWQVCLVSIFFLANFCDFIHETTWRNRKILYVLFLESQISDGSHDTKSLIIIFEVGHMSLWHTQEGESINTWVHELILRFYIRLSAIVGCHVQTKILGIETLYYYHIGNIIWISLANDKLEINWVLKFIWEYNRYIPL